MSRKNEGIFSINAHHCEGMEHGFLNLGIPSKTYTDVKSISNAVNLLVKKFGPEFFLSDSPATEVQT